MWIKHYSLFNASISSAGLLILSFISEQDKTGVDWNFKHIEKAFRKGIKLAKIHIGFCEQSSS